MLISASTIQADCGLSADIVIVGAGPAGIVLALELEKSGLDILLIESGDLQISDAAQSLGEASHFDPQFHAPMTECTRHQVGGTSTIWGGRCVPYDPIDFDRRDYIPHSTWPIRYDDITPYFQRACDYFLCGHSEFSLHDIQEIAQKSIIPGLPDGTVLTSALERWCLPTNFGKEYLNALKQSQHIRLIYGLTCTNIQLSNGSEPHVTALQAKTLSRKSIQLKAKHYVLAGGALNTTRLLLASNQQHPEGIGNHSGLLGRYYMGHLSGDIATVQFTTPPQKTIYGFDRDIDQTYLRRRFSFSQALQQEKQLTNTVAWLSTPRIDNPNHGSGVLSFSYLTLSSLLGQYLTAKAIRKTFIGQDVKQTYQAHLKNVLRDLGQTLTFVPQFGYQRYIAKRKIPGLFIYSASNEYTLHYHAEQVPNPDSRVTLSDETDELGMRRLNIDLRYSDQDIESVVRAHRYWDDYLKQHNCGYLKYKTDQREASVWEQASDGFHQVGTTRMSEHPSDDVVDANCKVHHLENLFIASSAVFVTSGQANSTFMIVAFALRLADQLKTEMQG